MSGDSTRRVHQGSIFGYILACALVPTRANTGAAYIRAFALIVACLQLYTEAIADFKCESLMAFETFSNYTFLLYRLHMESA